MKNTLLFILCFFTLSSSVFSQHDAQDIQKHLNNSLKKYDLELNDVQDWVITDQHVSSISGVTHIYLRQAYRNIEIQTATASLHIQANGQLLTMDNHFIKDLDENISTNTALLDASSALQSVAQQMGYDTNAPIKVLQASTGLSQETMLQVPGISRRDISAKLVYEPLKNGTLVLAWNMAIYELDQSNWWDMNVDANTGLILSKINWVRSCNWDDPNHANTHHNHAHQTNTFDDRPSPLLPHVEEASSNLMVGSYNVYPMPIESPNHGGRSVVNNPEDPMASPFGWHDAGGTITKGNNCHAYDDINNNDAPGFSPDGGASLIFDFPINTTYTAGNPSLSASLTNLFFWTNTIHDVWYKYGFTEECGNFQEDNYGNGGLGSDYVFAEGQDGSGTCNANFATPPDGQNPTMQMYVCGNRDGSLDNGVVAHEYGHGISTRLTGGPANSGCLNNQEQMGEGWSDWFGMMMTIETGDAGTDSRGMGTWLTGATAAGGGIRTFPYSTNTNINPHTYDDINTEVAPHGVGSVWAMMLWEMTWELIAVYGFDDDFYNGTGGNNIAMRLVMEGLKIQPCSPGFVDGRDAILAADIALNGGANVCLIWKAFAKRGLGEGASQGSSASKTDGTESYDIPSSCKVTFTKSADITEVAPGGTITYTITATNSSTNPLTDVIITDPVPTYTTYVNGSASNGGSVAGGIVSFPGVNLGIGATITRTFSVTVNANVPTSTFNFTDDMESGTASWIASSTATTSNWVQNGTNPNSGTVAWFAADVDSPNEQYLQLASAVTLTASSELNFAHSYDTEATWDGGVVEISTNNGGTWTDLGPNMTANGYNSTIDNNAGSPAFSGTSGGYVLTTVDLSSYANATALIRFRMHCDQSVGGDGWYIDDVSIGNLVVKIPNTAYLASAEGVDGTAILPMPTCIVAVAGDPTIQFVTSSLTVNEGDATIVDGCRTYRDYTVNVIADAMPSSPANVTIRLACVSQDSATHIEDFLLMTSSFTVANAGTYPVDVRVYDEGNIEGTETIDLELTLDNPGGTNATIGSTNISMISIIDNDDTPVGGGTSSVVLWSSMLEANPDDSGLTSFTAADGSWFLGNETTATSGFWTVPSNGSTQFAYTNDDECDCDMSDIKLIIPTVDLTGATGATLDLNLFYEGRSVNSGVTESAQLEASISGGAFTPVTTLAGVLDVWRTESIDLSSYVGNADVRFAIRYNDNGGWMYGIAVDDLSITAEYDDAVVIADALNDTDEQYVGGNSDVYFYHSDGSVMARIQNMSDHDFGCVRADIDRAGTGSSNFQDTNTANNLADKTFFFIPEYYRPWLNCMIYIYFTASEVQGWEMETGHNFMTDAKVITSPTSLSPSPHTGTVQVNTAITSRPNFAPVDYCVKITLLYDFYNDGSDLALAVGNPDNVILPIELLDFKGNHIATKGNQIEWTTLSETQNDFFELERSFDGQTFEKIATIAATNLNNSHYEFLDTKYQKGDNYYRLVQQDMNGQRSTTPAIIIQVKTNGAVNIFPNPTQSVVHVQFDDVLSTTVEMELFDALGRKVQSGTFDLDGADYFNFNTNELANGMYHLNLKYNGTAIQEKIVKAE